MAEAVHTLRCTTCNHLATVKPSHGQPDDGRILSEEIVTLFTAAHAGHDTDTGEPEEEVAADEDAGVAG